MMKKKILGAALGTCVHVSGLYHFLKLAEKEGHQITFAGPAVSPHRLVELIRTHNPDMVAISYRLTPEVAHDLFAELGKILQEKKIDSEQYIFGGTPPVALIAKESGLFNQVFDGTESVEEIKAFLQETDRVGEKPVFAADLVTRIQQKYPYPLLRHHFGRPSLHETIAGAKKIAEAQVLDVLSLGPDQNAQEYFFHPKEMDPTQNGAGGVPLRKFKDLAAIYEATRCGNFPLLRCYSGTRDLIPWAEMSVRAIHNAWGAIPLCWYSLLDGRSQRPIETAIRENQATMRWYAAQGIPVEVNESHQWSLRDAHDALAVAMAFLAAYNAKKMGVRYYVAQYMFNTPTGTVPAMDLAKMAAKKKLIEALRDNDFIPYTEVRAGIAHFSSNAFLAKGQLAASAVISQIMNPHILHVVGYSEGDHAVSTHELMESCQIIHGVLHNCLHGLPDMTEMPIVKKRTKKLLAEAKILLTAIQQIGAEVCEDPWIDARVLTKAIQIGLLDTPHFRGNANACGKITTQCIDGAWSTVDPDTGRILSEEERIVKILRSNNQTITQVDS